MKETDFVARFAEDRADEARTEFVEAWQFLAKNCQSPIERVFLAALMRQKPEGITIFGGSTIKSSSILRSFPDSTAVEYTGGLYVQVKIEPYTPDFYMEVFELDTGERWFRCIFECDGHEFHQRTKEQALRDKRRDRWFAEQGIVVARFTGTEIWRDPEKCAEQAFEIFWLAERRHYRRQSA